MSGRVIEIQELADRDFLATQISYLYEDWHSQMINKISEWRELRNYIFATSTKDTTNSKLPWKNTTTTPKLAQLRDNLHANYMDAIFPGDNWFRWEADDESSALKAKSSAIEAYIRNKAKASDLRGTISDLLYDYIDYGNAVGDVAWENDTYLDPATGDEISRYTGPKALRVSPLDIIINPTARTFAESPKITRSIKTFGELMLEAQNSPEQEFLLKALDERNHLRRIFSELDPSDTAKSEGMEIDGFGSITEYYQSPYVEILEFEGTLRDESGQLLENRLITIVDRSSVIRNIPNPSWSGRDHKVHAGWRPRPDNLWAMGPLDNLVGMQYRLDHLENIKADLFDLIAHPPIKIRGNVEEFEWGPLAEIFMGDDGDVDILKIDATALTALQEMEVIMQRMEDMAGAPRAAMGIRTPGEKTAFEVSELSNASGRIFNNRIRNFEINVLEPILNNFLEVSVRNLDGQDVVSIIDDDLGVQEFLTITRDDITGKGRLRPIGSRHFAATAQLVQNLNGVFNSGIGQMISPHVSPKALAKMVENAFQWEKFGVIQDNVAVMEQAETQRLMNASQEDVEVEAITPGLEDVGNVEG